MCEEGALITTGEENTESLYSELAYHDFETECFLKSDSSLRIRDCRIGNVAQNLWLSFEWDIDGIVAIFNRFANITTSGLGLG